METEPPGESERDKRASTVETPEDVDVPEEPEAWDSGSERGDDGEPEPDEDEERDEERMNTRGWHVRPEPPLTLPSSISQRLRDILARSRMASMEGSGETGGADSPDPSLYVLREDKYGEVVLERLPEEVELPVFQELEEVKFKPSIIGLMCKELVVAPCIDLFASHRHHQLPRYYSAYVCMLTDRGH